ncbi:AzlC family ABC transporter permease [Vibrio cincinnatiensis]|uniref:AzlC family ABC transporter permease n=1 Tax=Vibrio cincinnatiensis TaxID=675 RepID=UPI001302C948|nr:AzlC family ABC transporter permease [Vibrio cincinnatiensis]MCG3723936.1 branched-chain amino acid ABC transporter permease [Vibrio cincinnatiensis]MCG3727355.1 branched-chain amino acid ABC transporter permease [Vibrio cincinnatiensis]MCG3732287.1 branched-chain amino acid ABC transporter permease [Vibrio cincinnatiensis]MCG3738906.1 branched-chain amino acid ABC transporter permease [Vibrio cincinnatiensis]MCG3742053.1 branched-chain amino acid ABC transporter permease [Vibrio cincinnati
MSSHILSQHTEIESQSRLFWQGCLAMLPLSIAVLPWGLLAGSFAIDAGLTLLEGQALSAILFAGSAQLVAIGMMKTGAGLMTLLMTTFFITSRHFLYSVSMRKKMSPLPLRWRLTLGFLLTDELFAICGQQSDQQFHRWYALGAGLSFYLCWNLATLVGIIAGQYLPALNELGLEFAVAATFIAIVIPTVKNRAVLVSILVALILSVGLTVFHVEGSLMIASIGAMLAGFFTEQIRGGKV